MTDRKGRNTAYIIIETIWKLPKLIFRVVTVLMTAWSSSTVKPSTTMFPSLIVRIMKGILFLAIAFTLIRVMLLIRISTEKEEEKKPLLFQSSEEFLNFQKEFESIELGTMDQRKVHVREENLPKSQPSKSQYHSNNNRPNDEAAFLKDKLRHLTPPPMLTESMFEALFNRQQGNQPQVRNNDGYDKRLPKCLIIGFGKCGTHALKSFLDFHPEVAVTRPELNFFNMKYKNGVDWYRSRQESSYPNQITIEKSPTYVNNRTALELIYKMNSTIRLIAVVRDPIVHLQSQYAHKVGKGLMATTFKQWLEGMDVVKVHGYLEPIKDVLRIFPRNQLLVLDGEELVAHPLLILQESERFLRLKPFFRESHFYFNEDKGFYCANPKTLNTTGIGRLDAATGCFDSSKGREHIHIPPGLTRQLLRTHSAHNEALFRLLGKRFEWKSIKDL